MLRLLSPVLVSVALFAPVPPAAAAESADCADVLDAAAETRAALEQMEASLAQARADRAMLAERADVLAQEIAELRANAPTSSAIARLQIERADILAEIAGADEIIPKLVRQLAGLRAAVDEAERAYIACVSAAL